MFKKSIIKVLSFLPISVALQSCCLPAGGIQNGYSSGSMCGFPSSTSETHTKTTIVTPPSYATVNIPPPSISQAPPIFQQPMIMQAPPCAPPPYQSPPYQSHQCPPVYQSPQYNSPACQPDPCAPNYNLSVSQPAQAPRYTISIPQSPSPQYTISLPQGSPPQYSIMQQQAPVTSAYPVKIQAKSSQDGCD